MTANFADNIFKCIFFNENVLISIKSLLLIIPEGPINNILALVPKMVGADQYMPLLASMS